MTYWRLHYHLIWSTMERQPLLTPKVEKMFYVVIYRKAKDLEHWCGLKSCLSTWKPFGLNW
jgi:REP element-mobilizing transposase RayT